MEIPRTLVQNLALLHAKECNLFPILHELRSRDITRSGVHLWATVLQSCGLVGKLNEDKQPWFLLSEELCGGTVEHCIARNNL